MAKEDFRFIKNNIIENNLLFEKKIDTINFDQVIQKQLDFRDKRERQGLWDDKDLLRLRGELGFRNGVPVIEAKKNDILSDSLDYLATILASEPQKDAKGHFKYLLTSGLAVDLITGVRRLHQDIDLVIFDVKNGWWARYLTDNVTPQRYWANMKFDPDYLEETAWTTQFNVRRKLFTVSAVHPAIILVQKLSNAWSLFRAPREKDIKDALQLLNFWREDQDRDPSWDSVIRTAIAALPEWEQSTTIDRLAKFYPLKLARQTQRIDLFNEFRFR